MKGGWVKDLGLVLIWSKIKSNIRYREGISKNISQRLNFHQNSDSILGLEKEKAKHRVNLILRELKRM